jgi:hypothetical protein
VGHFAGKLARDLKGDFNSAIILFQELDGGGLVLIGHLALSCSARNGGRQRSVAVLALMRLGSVGGREANRLSNRCMIVNSIRTSRRQWPKSELFLDLATQPTAWLPPRWVTPLTGPR